MSHKGGWGILPTALEHSDRHNLCHISRISTGRLICKTKPISTDYLSFCDAIGIFFSCLIIYFQYFCWTGKFPMSVWHMEIYSTWFRFLCFYIKRKKNTTHKINFSGKTEINSKRYIYMYRRKGEKKQERNTTSQHKLLPS